MSEDKVQQAITNMMKNLEEKTGKSLEDWKKILSSSGLQKHGELVSFLKTKHKLTHGYANMVVLQSKKDVSGTDSDSDDLINAQYKGKEGLLPVYKALVKKISAFGKDIELSPKKAYVSVRRKKQFAIIQPSVKTRLDLGINLKGVKPLGILEASGSFNAMCSHRVRLENEKSITSDLIKWLKMAYEQAG